MIRSKVAFQHSFEGRILVTLEVVHGWECSPEDVFAVTAFDDENDLLRRIILASLPEDETIALVSKILLTVTGRPYADPWVPLNATLAQISAMNLRLPAWTPRQREVHPMLRSMDLRAALEQTPIPLILMEGPEHLITFTNEGYLRLVGRQSFDQLLGRTIREAFPELDGQPFFGLLDRVYATGKPYSVNEIPARIYSDRTHRLEDIFYDLIYYPVRDGAGEVCGVICQPSDATERALDRQVRDAREAQLFRQWAELEALYRTSPVGMALIRASDLSIQRVNDFNASLIGRAPAELIGRSLGELYPNHPFVPEAVRRVIREKTPRSLEITSDTRGEPRPQRSWHWNLYPILDMKGAVESVSSVTMEITDQAADLETMLDAGDLTHP